MYRLAFFLVPCCARVSRPRTLPLALALLLLLAASPALAAIVRGRPLPANRQPPPRPAATPASFEGFLVAGREIPIEILLLSLVGVDPNNPNNPNLPIDLVESTANGEMDWIVEVFPPPVDPDFPISFRIDFDAFTPVGQPIPNDGMPELVPPVDPEAKVKFFDATYDVNFPGHVFTEDPLPGGTLRHFIHFETAPHLAFTHVGVGSVHFDLIQTDAPPDNFSGPLFTIKITADLQAAAVPEPSSLTLLLGLATIAGCSRYRRSRSRKI